MNVEELADLNISELRNLLNTIGNTPMVPIYLVIDGKLCEIHLKLEGSNPGGSVKDRTAQGLINDLRNRGLLKKGSIILDSTSGNLGVALALISRAEGYEFLAVVDPKTTTENLAKLHKLGASIDMVHEIDANGGYLLSRLERVRQLCESTHFVWANQYSNPANPLAHYYHTGPEIYLQMNGNVDAVFIAVSTGGTLAGIGRYLREVSPSTRIVGVDAKGSIVFGGIAGPRKLTGIGSSRKSSFLAPELYDQYILVGDEEAFSFCRALYSHVGIKVGGSSGAVLAACSQYLKSHPEIHRVVCLCPDKGDNYQTSIFNDLWLEKNGLILSENKIWPTTNIVLTNKKLYPVNVSLVKQ